MSERLRRLTNPAPGRAERGERGASMVEFAIIASLLFLLIFGIIDFGATYSNYTQLRNGTREGARYAVVDNFGTYASGCGITGSATGTTDPSTSTDATNLICRTKDRVGLGSNGGLNNTVRVYLRLPNWGTSGAWAVGDPIVVCTQYAASSTTGVTAPFLSGKVMTARVEMRIEQPLATGDNTWTASTYAESPLPNTSGGTWPSKCTTDPS